MADISKLSRLVGGIQRQVDLSSNTLVVNVLKVGGGAGTDLTKAILDNLVNLQNGTDFANGTNAHTHDGRYFTEAELASATASSGSDLIGDDNTYANFTPSAATVKGALQGIDSVLSGVGGSSFADDMFEIYDDGDPTKKIVFQASGIATSTSRIITMPDANVNLGLVLTAIQRDGSIAFTANQPMGGFKLTGLAAGSGAGDSVRYEQAILASGANAFAANQSFGGFKATNLADPTANQDAATKAYVDSLASGLDPKASVRAATTAALPAATYDNGASGVGATLTADANGALPAQDGITLVVGNRFLVKDQADPIENGIYTITAVGDGSNPFVLTRAIDQDGSPAAEVSGGNFTFVEAGTVNAGSGWTVIWDGEVAIGTDPLDWSIFSNITFIGGDMVNIVGNTISVDLASSSGLESTNPGNVGGQLRVKLDGATLSRSASGMKVSVGGITDLEINASAAINVAKLANGSVSNTEFQYLAGVTSAIQGQIDGKASTTLNNLGTTSINADLLPSADVTRAIGSATLRFLNIYVSNLRSGSTGPRINLATGEMYDSANVIAADFSARELSISGLTKVSWSGNAMSITNANNQNIDITPQGTGSVNIGSKKIINVADPVSAQDAATKNYVDSVNALKASSEVAGEAFSATTLYAIRYGQNAETAGRMYKADKDASSTDNFYAMGLILTVGALSAADPLPAVTKVGLMTVASHGFTVGKPVYLGASGALTSTAPTATNDAVVKVGMVKDANTIDVQIQVMGVN